MEKVKAYYHSDRLGSTVHLTDMNGKIIATANYDEWGSRRNFTPFAGHGADLDLASSYTGHAYDKVLGQYYAQARMYNATNKRFLAEDLYKGNLHIPISLLSYAYYKNSPMVFVDPDGLVTVNLRDYATTYQGAEVTWDDSTKTATVSWDGKSFDVRSTSTNNRNGSLYVSDALFVRHFGVGTDKMVVYHDASTDNVSIRANFNIKGNALSDTIGNSSTTYGQAFLSGVSGHWTGNFGKYDVSTYTRESASGIRVNINNVNLDSWFGDNSHMRTSNLGISAWSRSNPGTVHMRTGDSRTGTIYTCDEFEWVSAHEFGHILGVGDAYNSQNSTGVTSMFNVFGTDVQAGQPHTKRKTWKSNGNSDKISPN